MDLPKDKAKDDLEDLAKVVPVLSEYAKSLDSHIKRRYLQKVSLVGVDPASIPSDQFDPDCLPPIEATDLVSYLVLETSYYTKQQFKAYKSLEAFNQMVIGWVKSVRGKLISGRYVVVGKVKHSQRMSDPLVDIWIITESDGTILSVHCLGCKAGLAESCSHVACVLFYIEAWIRINGKLSCTQVKSTWLLPTYVNEVPYARIKDINFSSAKKLKENLDRKIDSLDESDLQFPKRNNKQTGCSGKVSASQPTKQEMAHLCEKLNNCKTKAVALSLNRAYSEQFVATSRNVPLVSDLFQTDCLDMGYQELLKMCMDVKLTVSDDEIKNVERDSRDQAKGSGFFRHRAGRIGASVSGTVFHSNLAQPPQSCIKSVCYPNLYKLNTQAIRHGCKYEAFAIKAYEMKMKSTHKNFELKRCGLFINKKHPFLHATPDFLMSCDCCGLGCGEVKCPLTLHDGDFKKYAASKHSCIEENDGKFTLKRNHNYFHQVQQQLFTLPERACCDFVVCGVDTEGNAHLLIERIMPDTQHMDRVLPKLEAFWRICILPEILGRWYTRRLSVPVSMPKDGGICFCRAESGKTTVTCSNTDCPYKEFHKSCLALDSVTMPKTWYCPNCSRLPQFKRGKGKSVAMSKSQQSVVNKAASQCDSICICSVKATLHDKLVQCHNQNCTSGKFFHIPCLGLKRMPNNSKTTWQCPACRKSKTAKLKATTYASYSSSSSSETEDDQAKVTGVSVGVTNKTGVLGNLTQSDFDIINSSTGWLDCNIIQQAQVLLQQHNPLIDGFQRTTLGPARNFDIVNGEFVQILHTGSDHWVCVSSVGCQPGIVHLFDSLYNNVILSEVEEQIQDMLGGKLGDLVYVPTQQQSNGSDCGVFAIATATCLTFGEDPTHMTIDVSRMRPHLATCLRNGKIDMFPHF